jgi:ceramide glucosyltransferase
LRWMVVMRHMRPAGHLGLLFTQGLPWALLAIALHPSASAACVWLGVYLALRLAIMWTIGMHGLKRKELWRQMPLIPLWDALAFFIWVTSFFRTSLRWRDGQYHIRNGELVPVINASSPR